MTQVCRELFKAIHTGRWLAIEYKNRSGETTNYWIAVKKLDARRRRLIVDGLHLGQLTVMELSLYLDSILSASLVDGSWCPINDDLVEDIRLNPAAYRDIFSNVENLRVLDYLSACNRLNSTPYKTDFSLIHRLDGDRFVNGVLPLDEEQFRELVQHFNRKATASWQRGHLRIRRLALNVISLNTHRGLYVLAYRPLDLDVKNRCLRQSEDLVVCREFTVDSQKKRQSILQFLDADDFDLLDDAEKNLEKIKDCLTQNRLLPGDVDDIPYLIAIERNCLIDLEYEYSGILQCYQKDSQAVPQPIRAFFGELTARPRRRKAFPLALLNRKINLDQLLAINNAMRYPLNYVQGPPGTGKTNTIVNTISTAFFNERTVLFSSYNNHPIDGVVEKLQTIQYRGKIIPFPIVRLGNQEVVAHALDVMREQYEQCKGINVYESTLDRNKAERAERAKQLTALLERYEAILDLKERRETTECLLDARNQMTFQFALRAGQLPAIDARLREMGTVTTADAVSLLDDHEEEFLRYLYYTSAKHIRRIGEPKNEDLRKILYSEDKPEDRATAFNRYLSDSENLKKFLRIYPIIATTCISAYHLGNPEPTFDMVIIDEASQCDLASSLVPILRGNSLMLVGDPQQLNPVILLDEQDEHVLRRRYGVTAEYDYRHNSIYKCYLACDSVSDEVLLRRHYRCHPKIIEFSNRKYYNGKLVVTENAGNSHPLVYVDVQGDVSDEKNVAPREIRYILDYLARCPDKSVGIITPFAKQRAAIKQELEAQGLHNVDCGTVHAFQGDEKDAILFSLAVTDRTSEPTYRWLKNNKELINVAVSRAKEQLVIFSNRQELNRLSRPDETDDLLELVDYVQSNGVSEITPKPSASRALGIKPYSTATESAFLENLNHALDNALLDGSRCVVRREVPIAQIFTDNPSYTDLFYTGRFDFVVFQRQGRREYPVLAIELDGKEHVDNAIVRERDRKKQEICREHNFELIRVENSYARRYYYIKQILTDFFSKR